MVALLSLGEVYYYIHFAWVTVGLNLPVDSVTTALDPHSAQVANRLPVIVRKSVRERMRERCLFFNVC